MPIKIIPLIPENGQQTVSFEGTSFPSLNEVTSRSQTVSVAGPESHAELLPRFWAEADKICAIVSTAAEVEAAIQAVKAEAAAASEALKNDLGAKLNSLSSNVVLQTLKDEILTDLKSYIDLKFTQIEAQLKAGVAIKEET
jgi:aminopeptidase N